MAETQVTSVKSRINKAFMELLNEKPYSDITVTDIINKAGVARVSYYRNYSSISEIVENITDHMAEDFLTDMIPMFSSNDDRKLREFLFNYFYRYKQNFMAMTPENRYNRDVIKSRIGMKVKALQQNAQAENYKSKYKRIAKLSLIEGIAQTWGNEGFIQTPEEMIDLTMSIITSF